MQSNRFHAVPNRADIGNFGKFGATYLHGTVFHQSNDDIKRKLRGHGKPRNVIAFSVQKTYWLLRACKKETVLCSAEYGRQWKFWEIQGYLSPWYRVCTQAMAI